MIRLHKSHFSWMLVILWMSLIFYLSAQPAMESKALSEGATEIVVEVFERIAPNMAERIDIRRFNYILRKNAHFFGYLVLGILVVKAVGKRGAALALLICVLYAISDEVHQLYVPGRSSEIKDVIIDSVGAAVGIGIYLGLKKIRKRS